ncbi:hypothetical protein Lalb_Chr01g0019831 [Lupinus albus]|uniref:Uncharacterized protein n=1 Tax=Lupinus albus TaxID=3870 RepID=A0A6A4R7C2_LUPAL|nr:hypothetical protein Lalb_Chr01g0019831 [Lupinus albus]
MRLKLVCGTLMKKKMEKGTTVLCYNMAVVYFDNEECHSRVLLWVPLCSQQGLSIT